MSRGWVRLGENVKPPKKRIYPGKGSEGCVRGLTINIKNLRLRKESAPAPSGAS